jgi:sugar phosphate isomerase/epimerase
LIGREAEKWGFNVAVENMRKGNPDENYVPRVGQEMEWIREVVDASDSLTICLDTGHANISGDVCEMARIAGNKLSLVHLSDNFGVWDNHLFPGEGAIPWKKLGRILAGEIGFAGPYNLESALPQNVGSSSEGYKKAFVFISDLFQEGQKA